MNDVVAPLRHYDVVSLSYIFISVYEEKEPWWSCDIWKTLIFNVKWQFSQALSFE